MIYDVAPIGMILPFMLLGALILIPLVIIIVLLLRAQKKIDKDQKDKK